MFMGAMAFEISGESTPPPLVKGVSTKMVGEGRVKYSGVFIFFPVVELTKLYFFLMKAEI